MDSKVHFEDFAKQISLESGFDVDTTKDYLYTLFDTIEEESAKKSWVRIRNFGSFHPVFSKQRKGVNPQTGEEITISAHYNIHFSSSKAVSNLVNSQYQNLKPKDYEPKNPFIYMFIALLLLLGIVGYLLLPSGEPEKEAAAPQQQTVEERAVAEPIQEEMAVTTQPEKMTKPMVSERTVEYENYIVERDDTLSNIADRRYGVSHFWPLLFSLNKENVADQDLIFSGSLLQVPATIDISYEAEKKAMAKGFVESYRNYKNLGRIEKSRWILYKGVLKIDRDLLKIYRNDIDMEDEEAVKIYLERYAPSSL